MSEWSTYRLADFLLFSPEIYYRLFELHNNAVWPAQLAAALAGLGILALTLFQPPWAGAPSRRCLPLRGSSSAGPF